MNNYTQVHEKGILNLIPKPNKDTRLVKNLRPITLLNVDYKMLEKVIANRMLPMLEDIISQDQRGFMPNRRICVNIRKMLDVIERSQNMEAVIISCDFQKAFDRIAFKSLIGAMNFFKFPKILVEWTNIIYTKFTVKVQNHGHLSKEIEIEQGLHQGGPNSSLYFLIIAEILAILLRTNQKIKGIPIDDIINVLNQFADDLDVFSTADEESVKEVFKVFDMYYYQTGLQINYDKTTIYRIGSLRFANAKMYTSEQLKNVKCTNEDINVLGVNICHENQIDSNYNNLLEKSKNIMYSWTNRGLSLLGKVTVINTLISAMFIYKMLVLPNIPQRLLKQFEQYVRNFIWDGRKPKISLNIFTREKGTRWNEIV